MEDDLPDEMWDKGEKLWLIHRAGIAACRVLPKDSPGANQIIDGKTKVKLEQDGSVLVVDEGTVVFYYIFHCLSVPGMFYRAPAAGQR